jgi:hypothetical protein
LVLIGKGIKVVFNSGGKIRTYFGFQKNISLKFDRKRCFVSTKSVEKITPGPIAVTVNKMQSEPRPYFLLKYGKPQDQGHQLEVRNHVFELIGTCWSSDSKAVARLLAIPQLPAAILSQVTSMEAGKITRITL